jgi:hypothetical protein
MTSMSLTRRAIAFLSSCFVVCWFVACDSGEKGSEGNGGLVVLLESDLSIPKDIDHVTVDVTQFGNTILHVDKDIGAGALRFPAPLRVDPTGNTRPVVIHGVASKDGTPRIERSAVTSVPTAYVAEIRLPFDYLCDGTADADGTSTCDDGQTCKLGTCDSTTVPKSEVTRLPTSPSGALVDGGFSGTSGVDGGAGNCFDVVACMQGQPTVAVNASGCTVTLPPGASGDRLNVALLVTSGAGICSSDGKACWVTLDAGTWTSDGNTVTLPPGVCRGAQTPTVVVSGACRSKQAGTPVCGDWSSAMTPMDHPAPPLVNACDGELMRACGRCGKQARTCTDGVLSAWSACAGEGECAPADTQGCDTTGAAETCGMDCTWGACDCPKGQLACAGACVADDDLKHCGACEHDCTALDHVSGSTTCDAGKCHLSGSACAAGWGDCDGNAENGCEANLTVADTCGACDHTCSGSKNKCAKGADGYACVSSCPDTAAVACTLSSCVDVQTDPNDCGDCGNSCAPALHAQPSCDKGVCGTTCNAGYTACDGVCVDLNGDAAHCGTCKNACDAGKACTAGTCACAAGTHDCGGACASSAATATCGTSCTACTAPPGGSVRCDGTKCVPGCLGTANLCGGACVDEQIDGANCGACGMRCATPRTCQAGKCLCPAGQHDCNGTCVSNTAVATCGAACTPCAPPPGGSATCDGAKCGSSCGAGLTNCSGACVNEQTDSSNCGACAKACTNGKVCSAGGCVCPAGKHDCNGTCADNTAVATCGTSCSPCPTPTNGSATCDGTKCSPACAAGLGLCTNACVNEQTDSANCGMCGMACTGPRTCQTGKCVCPSGQHDCNGACVSNSAVSSCGASCTACAVPSGGSATCDGTKCGQTCSAGQSVCSGACVNEQTDSNNCGACAKACGAGKACVSGACQCPAGQHDCNGTCVDSSSVNTCGTACSPCATPTNGTATCNGATCGASCNAGLTACGSLCDVTSQACGHCGTQTRTCVNGAWSAYSTCGNETTTPPGSSGGGYDFDDGTTQGWTVAGPYDGATNNLIASSSIDGLALFDDTNEYPNAAASDPNGNGLGAAIVFALGGTGWTAPTNQWRMDFISPALSDTSPFQNHHSVSFGFLDHSGGSAPALQTQLLFQVQKCDGSTSFFRQVDSGGNSVFCRTTYGSWTTCRFDVTLSSSVSRVMSVQIRVFGSTQFPYEGTADIDAVHAL